MPAPSWLRIGEFVVLRPRDPSASPVADSQACVVYIGESEVHLRLSSTATVVAFRLDDFERDWMPYREASPLVVALSPNTPPIYAAWAPEFVGRIPVRQEIGSMDPLPIPSGPPELVRMPFPTNVTSRAVPHPMGAIQELQGVQVPFPLELNQVVEVEQGGSVRSFIVTVVRTMVVDGSVMSTVNLRENVPMPPEWMRTGARLASHNGGPGGLITGFSNGQVHIRDIERWDTTPIQLGGMVRAFAPQQVEDLYQPVEVRVPPWASVGMHIVQIRDGKSYSIVAIDPIAGAITVTPEGENRPTRFALGNLDQHWRPAGSLLETRPVRNQTPIVAEVSFGTLPSWLTPGVLVRTKSRPRRVLWVSGLEPTRGKVRFQRVRRIEPDLEINSNWEEVDSRTIERDYDPLDSKGAPLTEYKCPECGETGTRYHQAEERSDKKVRIYRCAKTHLWSFVADGSGEEGDPAPLSRFEREFDF